MGYDMPSYILSTCGTSLFTNGIDNDLRAIINKYSNKSNWENIPEDDKERLKQHIESCRSKLLSANDDMARKMSAEINGLLAWNKKKELHKQDIYHVLQTDTVLGKASAKIVKEYLVSKGFCVEVLEIGGLKTSQLKDFRESLSGLVKRLAEVLNSYQDSKYSIVFNLTGGFKSLNGFLQAVATIYADEVFYLFEGSDELMIIPKLPFNFNSKNIVKENLHCFRRLSVNLPVNDKDIRNMSELFLFRIDEVINLSEWGELLWQDSYKEIYKEKLWESISDKVIIESSFQASVKNIKKDILSIVNQRVCDIAYYTETGGKEVLRSVDIKALQGVHKKDNMYECDVGDNYRIFMKKENDLTFVLQKVDKALH